MHQMTEESRCNLMDSLMEDVHALLASYAEAGDTNAFRALFEEWEEYLVADDNQPLEVVWVDNMNIGV
jgi:DNA-binding transcriptional regulator YbjK